MKKLFFIFCVLYSYTAMAQLPLFRVGATDYSYSHLGNKYTFYLFSQFSFGSGGGPKISGYITQISNDTLYVKALYNTVGVWASWYSTSRDTIRDIIKDDAINFFRISSNSYYYNKDGGAKTDTSWNDDDTTFAIAGTGISAKSPVGMGFGVYPNPSNGAIIIKSESKQTKTVKVYDLLGRIIYNKQLSFSNNEAFINLDAMNGIYMLEVKDSEGNVYRQKIKISN